MLQHFNWKQIWLTNVTYFHVCLSCSELNKTLGMFCQHTSVVYCMCLISTSKKYFCLISSETNSVGLNLRFHASGSYLRYTIAVVTM